MNARQSISNQITCSIDELKGFDNILDIAYEIESDRNKIGYGKNTLDEELRSYIDLFFKLKKEVENA